MGELVWGLDHGDGFLASDRAQDAGKLACSVWSRGKANCNQ
jgi:hypothetical protein